MYHFWEIIFPHPYFLHSEEYIFISFQIEWNIIVITVFFLILIQMEFHLVQMQKENYHYDHIPLHFKEYRNLSYIPLLYTSINLHSCTTFMQVIPMPYLCTPNKLNLCIFIPQLNFLPPKINVDFFLYVNQSILIKEKSNLSINTYLD